MYTFLIELDLPNYSIILYEKTSHLKVHIYACVDDIHIITTLFKMCMIYRTRNWFLSRRFIKNI